jgi:L-aspartate oxidase
VRLLANAFLVDLLSHRGGCVGALFRDGSGRTFAVLAKRTILATGGAGQIYRETTNPPVATGDGISAAFRAGATLADLEFVQFHPTVLYIAGATRALISEAVRGAGAVLRDRRGSAFMKQYHPMADLAPRDAVSRAILHQMIKTGDTQVYLDIKPLLRKGLGRRFPGMFDLCRRFGLDPGREPVPVRPAAHYFIGGIFTDEYGQSSVRNMYAAGECAASGFHGANRLASNSLLECLVFGRRAGMHAGLRAAGEPAPDARLRFDARYEKFKDLDLTDMRNSLMSLMWRNVAIERDERRMKEAVEKILFWSRYVVPNHFDSPQAWELQNMMTVALGVTASALARRESRGVHYRADHPGTSREWEGHTTLER